MSLNKINTKSESYNNFIEEYYDDFAEAWDDRFQGTRASQYFFNKRLKKMKQFIGNDYRNILDVGCGTGYNLLRIISEEKNGFGIDISEKMILRAKKSLKEEFKKFQVEFNVGDGEKIDFPSDTFDRVIFTGYLGHIQNRKESLIEIKRVLQPTGRLVALVTNSWSPWYWFGLRKVFNKDYGVLPKDLEFSPIQIKKLLKSSGYNNIKIQIFNSVPGSIPDYFYYPSVFLNELLFNIYPIKLMGWHLLFSAEK